MRKSPDNDVGQLSDDLLEAAKQSIASQQEVDAILGSVEKYVPDNTHILDMIETGEDLERTVRRQQRDQRWDAMMADIRPTVKGYTPKFDTEGLSDLEIDQLYADMNPYEVFQQAVGNVDENSNEILEGLGKLAKEILPWLSLDATMHAKAWSHLQKEDSMLRALGFLVLGAGYNAALAATRYHPDPKLHLFLGSPSVRESMQPYDSVFHAMVDMYKKNYGLDGRGMIGLKRYIGEQPMDFLGDMLTFVSFATAGASIGAKVGSLSLRSSQLSQLKFHKFFTRNFQNYFNRSGTVNRVFNRLGSRLERIHGKLPHLLDYVHEKTWYLGTGVKGGNYPPGYWATLAYYVLQYGDVGNVPFALGGEALNLIGMAGTLSKSTEYAEELDDIATELFKKFHRDSPEGPRKKYTLNELSDMELANTDMWDASDIYTPFVIGYDVDNIAIDTPVRFIHVDGDYIPHIYVGDDVTEFYDAYIEKGFYNTTRTSNLDVAKTDKLRAEGKLRPLDSLSEAELAAYRVIPADFELENFILQADRGQKLPTFREHDVEGEPEFTYQLQSNERLRELHEDIGNFFDKDLDTDNLKREIYQYFRERSAKTYDDLDKYLGGFTRGGHNYKGVNIDELPMISYFENTLETWEKIRYGRYPHNQADRKIVDIPQSEMRFMDNLLLKVEEYHEGGTSHSPMELLLHTLAGDEADSAMNPYRTVEANLEDLELVVLGETRGTVGHIKSEISKALKKYLFRNAQFLQTSGYFQRQMLTVRNTPDELNKTIGTLRHLQNVFLEKSIQYPNSKTYVELYNAVTQDYYRNLRENIENSTAMDHPIIQHIFERELSKVRDQLGEQRFAQIHQLMIGDARTHESIIITKVLQKYDELSHIHNKYDRGVALMEYIRNDLDIENVAFWNENVAETLHYELMDQPGLRTEVTKALKRIAKKKQEMIDKIGAVGTEFEETARTINLQFRKFLFTAIDNMDNPQQAQVVSKVFLDPDMVPDAAIPQVLHQVGEETMNRIRSEVARELMRRSQTWDNLGFRIISFEFEDIFTQISRDWELGGLIERIRTVANYPDGSTKNVEARKVLREYVQDLYSNRTYFDEPFTDEMIDEVVKTARKGNAGLLELLEYFQPYGGAHFFDTEMNSYSHKWLHLLVGHDGVYAADDIAQGYEFWEASNNVARGEEALVVFEYVDSGGFGIDKVEKILQPTRVVGVYNPVDFYNAYLAGNKMWRNANNLRAQIRRVGEERLRLLWGDEYLESFKKFAKLSEEYPLLTSGGRERVLQPVDFQRVRSTEEELRAAHDPDYVPDTDDDPAAPKFLKNLVKGLMEDKKALDEAIEEGLEAPPLENTEEIQEILQLLDDTDKAATEAALDDFDDYVHINKTDELDDIDELEEWADEVDDTSHFLGMAVTPSAPLYDALQETGLPKILDNADPAIDNLELMLSTLDIEMVMKIITSPAMVELIVKDLSPNLAAKVRSWLTVYRRAERKLYETTQKEKKSELKNNTSKRERVNSYNRSRTNIDSQLRHVW